MEDFSTWESCCRICFSSLPSPANSAKGPCQSQGVLTPLPGRGAVSKVLCGHLQVHPRGWHGVGSGNWSPVGAAGATTPWLAQEWVSPEPCIASIHPPELHLSPFPLPDPRGLCCRRLTADPAASNPFVPGQEQRRFVGSPQPGPGVGGDPSSGTGTDFPVRQACNAFQTSSPSPQVQPWGRTGPGASPTAWGPARSP